MFQVEALTRAVDFIERNLRIKINVGDMAEAAGYSLYHFCRLFSQNLHISPYDYLVRRRLSQALEDVLVSRKSILEIALDFQFETSEGFSRAFCRLFGKNPSQIRHSSAYPLHRKLPPLNKVLIRHIFAQNGLPGKAITLPVQEICGLMTEVRDDDLLSAVGILDHLPDRENRDVLLCLNDPLGGRNQYLIAGYTDLMQQEDHFIHKSIPGGEYQQFTHYGGMESLQLSLDWILYVWAGQQKPDFQIPFLLCQLHSESILLRIPVS